MKSGEAVSLFTISDLHLSFGADKPMNIFRGWDNHTERIEANWRRLVRDEDTVILPGDFSWSLKLADTAPDFAFLHALPGKKLILKGNHDLWWSTSKKINDFLSENGFDSIKTIFNNCSVAEGRAICGTRGWFYDDSGDKKVLLREAGRLEASITAAKATGLPILVFLHYPPVYGDSVCYEIFDILKRHGIGTVYHGHIHGGGYHKSVSEFDGIRFKLVSCDCVDFTPICIV